MDKDFARGKAQPQPPPSRRQLVAVDDVAGSIRLHDFDRLQVCPPVHLEAGCIVAVERRYREDAGIVDPDHLARVDVDDRRQALDRMGGLVVARTAAEEYEALPDAPAALVLAPEYARRPQT